MIKRPGPDAPQKEITNYLNKIYKQSNLEAVMNQLHLWSLDSDYINRDKLEKNSIREFYDLDYDLYFSYQINYARAGYQQKGKPALPEGAKCLICRENASSSGKEKLRIFDIELQGENEKSDFFLQLTPFPLFPRHLVLINKQHIPMNMCAESIAQSLSFVEKAPDYTLCSNSDLEWAGASILSHSHFQLLHKRRLPVMNASGLFGFEAEEGLKIEALQFPVPAIKLRSEYKEKLITEGSRIIDLWKKTAPGQRTVNMLIYREENEYVCILILRDSKCRNPEELQKYKSEGIGVVEAAGSWIFPPPADYPEEELTQKSREIIKGFFEGISAFDHMDIEGYDFLPYLRKKNV
jgi:UDPglucose--hexose-1-phosphate uridylyltransferase